MSEDRDTCNIVTSVNGIEKIFRYDDWPVELFSDVLGHRKFFYFILLNTYFLDKILPSRNMTPK